MYPQIHQVQVLLPSMPPTFFAPSRDWKKRDFGELGSFRGVLFLTENLHTGLEAFLAKVKCLVGLNKPEMYECHFEFFPPTPVQSLKPCFHART